MDVQEVVQMTAKNVWNGLKDVLRVSASSSGVHGLTDASSRLNAVRDPYAHGSNRDLGRI